MAVGGQRHDPAALSPGKTQYSLYRRLGGPQGRSGMVQKTLPPRGSGPEFYQPVASLYTDCAIPVHVLHRLELIWSSKHLLKIGGS